MKIIGINGSPRLKGNTAQLLDEALQQAENNGAATTTYNLNRLNLKGCQGCYKCREIGREGTCVLKDDMNQILEEILSANAVVLASPVYMWQMTAQTKIFTDRLMPLLKPDYSSRLSGQKLLSIYTQGQPDLEKFKQYFDYVNAMFSFLGFRTQEPLVAGWLRDVNDIHEQPEAKENARKAAENLILADW
ncbi:flavodoxin family protein [Desulfosediminicola flagellatus]|uniref:flavodoxin family protein n=1 Tax=Desulfosediminicola flagellatus TaxID=2569541 RepID=UPI00142EBCBF|nr:flavodoxin family protein [Desulfosediminicola flagellatus]